MPANSVYIKVALSGPLRQTFTYRTNESDSHLTLGQRLLVPFGRSKKIGFYVGQSEPIPGIRIKNIIRPLDRFSYFSDDLFKLCLWIADYYFANPADCLQAALPPLLKSQQTPQLIWGDIAPSTLPENLREHYKSARPLSRAAFVAIGEGRKDLLRKLIRESAIVEEWPVDPEVKQKITRRYHATRPDRWEGYFSRRTSPPALFPGWKRRAELLKSGWTDHLIKKAVNDGMLLVEEQAEPTLILDFVLPRGDVANIKPNQAQQKIIDRVIDVATEASLSDRSVDKKVAHPQRFLLHGVTGSGKTLVYCHICSHLIAQGKTVLVMTPEIALAGTTLSYFRGFFGDKVTVIHSGMTSRERMESFNGIRQGKYTIVVGPRSALFAPIENLGLIIVDEEHDGSYKQDDPAPRFHGRDSAIMRAKLNNVPILLGSASPSIESYYHAKSGKYELLKLTHRPAGAKLPTVRVIDLRTDRIKGEMSYLSWTLKKGIEEQLDGNHQVILYLNRRGHSPALKCSRCGHSPECPNCQVKLTFHKVGRKLSCHYCGYLDFNMETCSECGKADFNYTGVGTQKVEEHLPRIFDSARVARLDSDTASGRKRAHTILSKFARGENNLLLGTQMVTKGLDLAGVTLVGVLSADSSLDMPDFRADEKTFSRLLQVSGRAGRAEDHGEVMIQTWCPEHDVISFAAAQDYQSFFEREIESRKATAYPPFTRLVRIILSSTEEQKVEAHVQQFRRQLETKLKPISKSIQLLGPAPCSLYYLRKSFRRQVIIKTTQVTKLTRLLTEWEADEPRFGLPSKIKVIVDIDPDDMM